MERQIYDLAIIGGGMAGLSAAINAGAEGLKTIIINPASKWGGQARDSSLIENFLGHPDGISGPDLANKSIIQAVRFGVTVFNNEVVLVTKDPITSIFIIRTTSVVYEAKSVLVTTGMSYKKLDIHGVDKFIGRGVQYGAPQISGEYCKRKIVIVGGANSAGQAAMFLAGCEGCEVHLVIRNENKTGTMSHYLSERVLQQKNIIIHNEAEVIAVEGAYNLTHIAILTQSCTIKSLKVDAMYIMVGGAPQTEFLHETVLLDKDCFIKSGLTNGLKHSTSKPGIFVAGDVRSGAVRRISTAVGEGASAINDIRAYLLINEKSKQC